MTAGVVLGTAGVAAAFSIGTQFGIVAAAYLAAQILYSFGLKHVVIVDVLMIAAGFVLRAIAGAVAVDVPSATGCSSARRCWRYFSRSASAAMS
jgi:UbiA prenyltransferase family.